MQFAPGEDRFHLNLTAKLNQCKGKGGGFGNTAQSEILRRVVGAEVSPTPGAHGVLMVRSCNAAPGDRNSFHTAMRPILTIAQCFGHIPVYGIRGPNADSLRFKACSFKVIYSIYCIFGCVFLVGIHASDYFIHHGSATFSRSSSIFFCTVAILNLTFCIILAKKWPNLMQQIQSVEVAMKPHYGYPKNFSRNLRIITYSILIASVVEHCISRVKELSLALECSSGDLNWMHTYFTGTYSIIFTYLVDYSFFYALILEHNRLVGVFAWNFMDVLVILFSMMLGSRLKQVNSRLTAVRNQVASESFWRQVREDYNELSKLVKFVDSHINMIIFLTFGNNLYFMCLQLLNSLKKEMLLTQSLYFYISFAHLLLRSVAMCLVAANIYDESKEPKSVLFSVSSESYTVEVQRFLTQVYTDNISLTGFNFFSVTKALLLTLAGTIVTYEIVLVQFDVEGDNTVSKVVNPFCPNRTITIGGITTTTAP